MPGGLTALAVTAPWTLIISTARLRRRMSKQRGNVPHGRLSIGHCCLLDSVLIHFNRQCM